MAAPAFRSAGTPATTVIGNSGITPGAPAGAADGDILILFAGGRLDDDEADKPVISANGTGWTEIDYGFNDLGSYGFHVRAWWYRVSGSVPTMPTVESPDVNTILTAQVAAYSGCITSGTPYEDPGTYVANGLESWIGVAVTTAGVDRRIVQWFFADDDTVGDPDTGWTEDYEQDFTSPDDHTIALDSKTRATAGTETAPTRSNGNERYACIGFALIPDTGATPIDSELAVTETADTLVASAAAAISGSLTVTESLDSLAGAAQVAVSSSLSVTESNDSLAAASQVAASGALAVTESLDSLAASASSATISEATLSVTETADTLAATSQVAVSASLAVTETADTLAANAQSPADASLAVTEASDTLAATAVTAAPVDCTLAVTEDDDTASANAYLWPFPAYVTLNSGVGTQATVDWPSDVRDGDWAVAVLSKDGAHSLTTPPSGFDYVGAYSSSTATTVEHRYYEYECDGTETGTISSDTWAGSEDWQFSLVIIRNSSGRGIGGGVLNSNDINFTSFGLGSTTPDYDNSLLIGYGLSGDASSSWTLPNNTNGNLAANEEFNQGQGTTTSGIAQAFGWHKQGASAATGTMTFAQSVSAPYLAFYQVWDPILYNVTASASVTEDDDSLSSSAQVAVNSTATVTESLDSLAAAAEVAVSGAVAVTETDDSLSSTSTVATSGSVSVTETDDTLAATATSVNTATLAVTEASDTLVSSAAVEVSGSLSVTENNDSLSASAEVAVNGTLAATETDDSLSSSVQVAISSALAVTEDDDTLVAEADTSVAGETTADVTEDDDTLAATAEVAVSCSVSVTESNDSCVSSASVAGGEEVEVTSPVVGGGATSSGGGTVPYHRIYKTELEYAKERKKKRAAVRKAKKALEAAQKREVEKREAEAVRERDEVSRDLIVAREMLAKKKAELAVLQAEYRQMLADDDAIAVLLLLTS